MKCCICWQWILTTCKKCHHRKKLAFFAGSINSPVRERLLQVWRNDSEISVHFGRLTTPYADELLGSKFCLHVKGFEINTARIADSLYYGCVPVIIANHYDLPFADILNWKSFSIVVATLDIPLLKQVLKGISLDEYLMLQSNVLKVRNHFQWHVSPVDYDAFYMVMYELWLRRSSVRVPLSTPMDPIHWLHWCSVRIINFVTFLPIKQLVLDSVSLKFWPCVVIPLLWIFFSILLFIPNTFYHWTWNF